MVRAPELQPQIQQMLPVALSFAALASGPLTADIADAYGDSPPFDS